MYDRLIHHAELSLLIACFLGEDEAQHSNIVCKKVSSPSKPKRHFPEYVKPQHVIFWCFAQKLQKLLLLYTLYCERGLGESLNNLSLMNQRRQFFNWNFWTHWLLIHTRTQQCSTLLAIYIGHIQNVLYNIAEQSIKSSYANLDYYVWPDKVPVASSIYFTIYAIIQQCILYIHFERNRPAG